MTSTGIRLQAGNRLLAQFIKIDLNRLRTTMGMEDIDVLVRPKDLAVVSGALLDRGYAKRPGTPADFVKALCLGADGIALANSAIQAVGCIGARMCNSNNCPAGIATQKPELRALLNVDEGAQRLARFFGASVELMQVLARACGHHDLQDFALRDLTTWQNTMAKLAGISFAGNTED
jgi:hypothetical protein